MKNTLEKQPSKNNIIILMAVFLSMVLMKNFIFSVRFKA